jgi:uncharacterized protein with von Willebrand factor type A (vWA) domain
LRFVYTNWTGTRRSRLDPDRLFAGLSRFLSETDDLEEALDRLMRQGIEGLDLPALGVDDLLARIREQIQELAQRYNLDHALDRQRSRLDELLELEEAAVGENGAKDEAAGDAARRARFIARLPASVREAMDRLGHYDFQDGEAAAEFERLSEGKADIDRVTDFIERHGRMFRGAESLDFDGALELIDRVERLRRLEESLFKRNFEGIDLAAAEKLIGADGARVISALRDVLAMLAGAGLVAPRGGKLVLTPKGARRLGQIALAEIHRGLRFDAPGRHAVDRRGAMDVDGAGTRRYTYGEPFNLAAAATVANAVRRNRGLPLRLSPEDLEVYECTHGTRSATVLLLDMSWSMSWEGRFAAAKKVALAMHTLMRSRYPRDYFAVVGFYTRAVELDVADLPEVTWNMGDPFTNLQDGLRLGSELLGRQSGANKNLIVVTDGQPTAYYAKGRLYCEWPMSLGGLSTRATVETLREVERVTRRGIRINTFMLDDSPPLRAFVDKMTAINRGRAFFTSPSELGRFLLVDHVGRRRKVV